MKGLFVEFGEALVRDARQVVLPLDVGVVVLAVDYSARLGVVFAEATEEPLHCLTKSGSKMALIR